MGVATGDVVVIQDADLEYSPSDLPAMIEPIEQGKTKVVYGFRDLSDQEWITPPGESISHIGNELPVRIAPERHGNLLQDG